MATFPQIMDSLTAIPGALETKFKMLPKLSVQMQKVDKMMPAGPNLPISAPNVSAVTGGIAKLSNNSNIANRFNNVGNGNQRIIQPPGNPDYQPVYLGNNL